MLRRFEGVILHLIRIFLGAALLCLSSARVICVLSSSLAWSSGITPLRSGRRWICVFIRRSRISILVAPNGETSVFGLLESCAILSHGSHDTVERRERSCSSAES